MFTSGTRSAWLNAVAESIMDGGAGSPPSMSYLLIAVPPKITTKENDGHVTAAAAFGEARRKDFRAGWEVIIKEMLTLLREQGFVGGTDQALTWIKPLDGTWQVTMHDGVVHLVFGQKERRLSRERSVVGERSEADGSRVGPPSAFERGKMQPIELQVLNVRGKITLQSFELHPFALAIPPMTENEREALRASIERDGVKVPIEIYETKTKDGRNHVYILDGRNRAYFASILGKPVQVRKFEGTEDEAKRHIASLNLHRRHLNLMQRSLIADQLFGRQAEAMAAEAYKQKVGRPEKSPSETTTIKSKDRSGESHKIAADLAITAGFDVTPTSMRAAKETSNAPETRRKIEAGEIDTPTAARKEASKEKEKDSDVKNITHDSIFKILGYVIRDLNKVLTRCELPTEPILNSLSERLEVLPKIVEQLEQECRERNFI